MMNNNISMMSFDEIRKVMVELRDEKNILEQGVEHPDYPLFKKCAEELISMCSMSLLTNASTNGSRFFGTFLNKGERYASYTIKRPIAHQVRNTGVVILYNPALICDYGIQKLTIMMIKEAIHLIKKHFTLQIECRDLHPWPVTKLACELECSDVMEESRIQLIEELNTRAKINGMFGCKLEKKEARELATDLHDLYNTNDDFRTFIDNTEKTAMTDGETDPLLIGEIIDYIIIETASEERGNLPAGLAGLIEKLTTPPVITWQQELAQAIGSLTAGRKRTIMRRNRRQQDRLDLRGELRDKEVDLVIAIDTSGSMSDDVIAKCMVEIEAITKHMKTKFTIVECDCEIGRVYEVDKVSDIKAEVSGRGGTYFSPVFRWMQENNKRDAMLIYLTDGYGEHQLADDIVNNHQCTLWVLTEKKEDLSLKGDRLPLRSRVISFTNK